jgi:hypothetical protein
MKKRVKVLSVVIPLMIIFSYVILAFIGSFEWFTREQNASITVNSNHTDGFIDYRIDTWWDNHRFRVHGIQGFITIRSSNGKFRTYWIGNPEYSSPNIGICKKWVAPSIPLFFYSSGIDESQCSSSLADDDSEIITTREIQVISTGKQYVSFINDQGLKIDATW